MGEIAMTRVYDARRGGDANDEVTKALTGGDDPSVFLVDRVWPRGVAKADLPHDVWLREVAPSTELRKWFNHDPDRFDEFSQRYQAELDAAGDVARTLVRAAREHRVVLLYSDKDEKHNQAVVLRRWINSKR